MAKGCYDLEFKACCDTAKECMQKGDYIGLVEAYSEMADIFDKEGSYLDYMKMYMLIFHLKASGFVGKPKVGGDCFNIDIKNSYHTHLKLEELISMYEDVISKAPKKALTTKGSVRLFAAELHGYRGKVDSILSNLKYEN